MTERRTRTQGQYAFLVEKRQRVLRIQLKNAERIEPAFTVIIPVKANLKLRSATRQIRARSGIETSIRAGSPEIRLVLNTWRRRFGKDLLCGRDVRSNSRTDVVPQRARQNTELHMAFGPQFHFDV